MAECVQQITPKGDNQEENMADRSLYVNKRTYESTRSREVMRKWNLEGDSVAVVQNGRVILTINGLLPAEGCF